MQLRPLHAHQDAPFIFTLLNSPGWLQFIGDRQIHDLAAASAYIENGPVRSYRENGYGLWAVLHPDTQEPIGLCGLIRRDGLEYSDLGFAFLPEHQGKGYAYKAAKEVLRRAREEFFLPVVQAIVMTENTASRNLLEKLGFVYQRVVRLYEEDLLLYAV
jgi:[ribosomal protein S5]-alanine N-acetyltransferase